MTWGRALHYIGSDLSGGDLISGEFSATYYFATDMSVEELKRYFDSARYVATPNITGGFFSSGFNTMTDEYMEFQTISGEEFTIEYYDNAGTIVREEKLKPTTKPHMIAIPHSDYELAKSAL